MGVSVYSEVILGFDIYEEDLITKEVLDLACARGHTRESDSFQFCPKCGHAFGERTLNKPTAALQAFLAFTGQECDFNESLEGMLYSPAAEYDSPRILRVTSSVFVIGVILSEITPYYHSRLLPNQAGVGDEGVGYLKISDDSQEKAARVLTNLQTSMGLEMKGPPSLFHRLYYC